MNSRSPFVTFVAVLAFVLVGLGAVLILVPLLAKGLLFLLALVPFLLTVAGLVSCVLSNKPTNIILLWIIVIVLAPMLGPLLWFFWGKKNT